MSVVARDLRVERAGRVVLSAVDLELPSGGACAVVGPNGAGKSTLLGALAGLLPSAGELRVDGIDPRTEPRRVAAGHVSLMPQAVTFPFAFSALDVAVMGGAGRRAALGHASEAGIDQARAALRTLGVEHLADRAVTRLSGGERQRVLFAMQLVQGARVVLLDEPTSALDFAGVDAVLAQVAVLRDAGFTVVAALHDLNVAAAGFDAIALLHGGTIADFGSPDAVLRGGALRRAYGDAFALVDTDIGPVVVPGRAGA